MAHKIFALDEALSVTIYKRKANRNMRLSIAANGEVRVSIPAWASYKAGEAFALSRQDWIWQQMVVPVVFQDGHAVGKAHHVSLFMNPRARKVSSRVINGKIIVSYPEKLSPDADEIQTVIREASVRALRSQAEKLLPQRLQTLAREHDFSYNSVAIKRLKGRWGSCDQSQHIVLNLYLMQLPWELIDYVLLHELTHTQILRHGPDFWTVLMRVLPNAKQLSKQIRAHQPVLV